MKIRKNKLRNLIDLATLLSQQTVFEDILRLVSQKAAALLEAETALIMMVNPETGDTLKTIIRQGVPDENHAYHAIQKQISGWMMRYDQPLLTENIQQDPRFRSVRFNGLPIHRVAAVLIQVEGKLLGTLIVLRDQHAPVFNEKDAAYLQNIAVISAPYLNQVQIIRQYFDRPLPDEALLKKYQTLGLLGKSKPFVKLLQTIEAAAQCDVRVLLEGESGVGKELLAKAIHKFGARNDRPFVAVDCGAIPQHLLESELFGHVKGAFTGSVADRKGLFEQAHGGTLFMDEIASLPIDMQAKFMRVLQEGEVRPLGSNQARKVDVRIIAASSASLKKLVESQKFREDLFFRLYVYPIFVPSLRERRSDISLLANSFLRRFAEKQNKRADHFKICLLRFMQARKWPGNIRELENMVERVVTLAPADTEVLGYDILPQDLQQQVQKAEPQLQDSEVTDPLPEQLAGLEEQLIRQALVISGWNQSQAARSLKISVQNLRYRMQKLHIHPPAKGSR